ncbi:MAG TPA: hypothetical protein VGQ80_01545 [Acidimicrobiia bacterium]|nr:hypothetical protein [Acidimicrobiia bacterium]
MDFVNWLKVERERVAAWSSIAIGGVCLIVGWVGVSGTKETYQQITYIVSGGISSLFFLGLGVGLLVSADLHDEWRKMDRLERALAGRPLPQGPDGDGPGDGNGPRGSAAPIGDARVTSNVSGGAATVMAASPLRHRDLTLATGGLILALLLLAGGWFRASGTVSARSSLDGVVIAMFALAACGLSMARYSGQIGRAVGARKRQLVTGLAGHSGPVPDQAGEAPAAGPSDRRYMAEGGVRFHRAGCPVLAAHTVTPHNPRIHRDAIPCDLCDAE